MEAGSLTNETRLHPPPPKIREKLTVANDRNIGTCSISLITLGSALQQLLMSELPGIQGSGSGWPFTDTERFKRIYDSLKALEHSCAAAGRVPGWVQLGMYPLAKQACGFLLIGFFFPEN